jgi:DNA-binding NarL/FixJ family response regulator
VFADMSVEIKDQMKIRVALVEDNPKLRKSLSTLLNSTSDLQCVDACADGETALRQLPSAAPDIVMMDIHLPGMSGIQCVARLSELLPQTRIVMLTAFESGEEIFDSLAAGAHGYLLKSTAPEQLLESIREVAAGGSPISGSVARKIVDFFRKPVASQSVEVLAPREREVLKLLAEGCPYKEIAVNMQVSLGTVRTYIERIYQKLHVHSRAEAAAKYFGRS